MASEYGSFPIVLETMRECLQDVFDVPGLVELMRDIEARAGAARRGRDATASPFARSLLFGYIAAFIYEGERRWPNDARKHSRSTRALLGELLGQAELREMLDADAIDEIERELQHSRPTARPAMSKASPTCCGWSAR